MKLLGLDNGYNFTKTSEGVSILSTIKHGVDDINTNVLQVKIGKKDYIVADENGTYVADADKLKSEESRELLKVCTLTAIGLSYPEESFIDVEVVAGLPVDYFSNQKDELKNILENINEKIYINTVGKEQKIRITKATIYPQSAGVVFSKAKQVKGETSLVIDIGGGTWDISQFDGLKMTKKRSYSEGMLILYSKIAQYLNSNFYTKYNTSDIYALTERKYFTVAGERKDINVVNNVVENHVSKVITDLKRDFDTTNVDNIFLIGGGAKPLYELLKKSFPNAILELEAQMANAKCFELMGQMKR